MGNNKEIPIPIYVYECDKCLEKKEELQRLSDAPLTKCEVPGCGGALTKKIEGTNFQLKGTGWYTTDYPKIKQ